MSAVAEMPPVEHPVEPGEDEPIVRAWRLDWSFDNLPHKEQRAVEQLDTGPVYYAEREFAQACQHVKDWLTQVPGSDVVVAIEEIPLAEWVASFLGDPDEVSR